MTLLLAAYGNDSVAEELNKELEAEAKEYSFIEFNGDEVVKGEKVILQALLSKAYYPK